MKFAGLLMVLLLTLATVCRADGYSSPPIPNVGPPPPPPDVGIDQHPGAKVPLDLPFRDEHWRHVPLRACTAGKPTILVLAYYRCPMLCTEVLNGLLRSLMHIRDDVGSTFNVVVVSFDPREKPPLAALKQATYLERYGRPGAERGWHFLTGESLAIEDLAKTVGFRYQYDAKTQQYAHGTGIIILAPEGTISRYLTGVRFEPAALQSALTEAAAGKIAAPVQNPVLLLCFCYDPTTGKYTASVLKIVRLISGTTILIIGAMVVSQIRRSRRLGRTAAAAPVEERKEGPPWDC